MRILNIQYQVLIILYCNFLILSIQGCRIQMKFSPHMAILKIIIQIFFVIQSVVLIFPTMIYRLILKFLAYEAGHFNPFKQTHADVFRSRQQMINVQGFKIQEFQCQTEDDAYVSLWRILPKQNQPYSQTLQSRGQKQDGKNRKKPILIQHGLLDCSMSWFLHQNPQNSLPYLLARQGYDVWIGNNRGTKYSSRNSHNEDYWQYNIDHLIQYDIPALINYILQKSKSDKLIYIGHSQGTTQLLSSLDIHPQISQKLETFIGFGPVISLKNLNNHFLLKLMDKLKICEILKAIGFKSMLIIPNWMSKLIGMLIYNCWIYFKLFMYVVTGLCGKNSNKQRINLQRFGVIISHQPGGSSINNVFHWIQMYRSGHLHKYDYGQKKNMQTYGQITPPAYTFDSLNQLPFQLHLFRGTADKIITDKDFQFLLNKLHPERYTVHTLQDYAHLDYIWCQQASSDIYTKILNILDENNKQKLEQK